MANTTPQELQIEQYTIDLRKQIGRGAFGAVYSCKNSKLGTNIAAKQFNQLQLGHEISGDNVQGELMTLEKGLKHENIIDVFDYHFKDGSSWIFMELCYGDL